MRGVRRRPAIDNTAIGILNLELRAWDFIAAGDLDLRQRDYRIVISGGRLEITDPVYLASRLIDVEVADVGVDEIRLRALRQLISECWNIGLADSV